MPEASLDYQKGSEKNCRVAWFKKKVEFRNVFGVGCLGQFYLVFYKQKITKKSVQVKGELS